MMKKIITLSALMLANISYAGEDEVRDHVKQVVAHLKVIEAAGINKPETVGGAGCDFPTIQEAIDSGADQVRIVAKANDEPYYENISIIDRSVALKGNYDTCANAEDDHESDVKAIIDAGKNGAVISINSENLNTQYNPISHLVIQHGGVIGGMVITPQDLTTLFVGLDDVIITNNSAATGGGIYFLSQSLSSHLYIKNSVIEKNIALVGGGLYASGSTAKVLIDGKTHIKNNQAKDGGGIFFYGGVATIFSPTIISGNKSLLNGGGLFMADTSWQNLYGKRVCEQGYCFGSDTQPISIIDNQADADHDGVGNGGGLYVEDLLSSLHIHNTVFKGNQAAIGGAFYHASNKGGSLAFSASLFEQNQADLGTVGAVSGEVDENSTPIDITIQDSVITNNGTGGNGDFDDGFLFYADLKGNLALNYNTIANNDVTNGSLIYTIGEVTTSVVSSIVDEDKQLYFGDALEAKCLLVKNNSNLPQDQEDIIVGNAMFADVDAGDYHLTVDSPAIDFCGQTGDSETDKDGEIRGFDDPNKGDETSFYDLGAYEFLGSDIIFEDGFEEK